MVLKDCKTSKLTVDSIQQEAESNLKSQFSFAHATKHPITTPGSEPLVAICCPSINRLCLGNLGAEQRV